MATNSITHNVVIDTPEATQKLIDALEKAEQSPQKHNKKCRISKKITGNEIIDFISKVSTCS